MLRPFRESDLASFLAYRNDPEVARFQSWESTTHEAAAIFVRAHHSSRLGTPGQWQQIAIALLPGDELIGDIGLFVSADGMGADLGFTIAREHQGHGFAREAVASVVEALFDGDGIERVNATTDSRNAPSIALLEALGFRLESTAPAQFKGTVCVEHRYVLTSVPRSRP